MCQTVSLQTAVLLQVQDFAANNTPFSVYDITRTIREKANNGSFEIPEVEVQGASFNFDIPHVKVKGIFDELFRTGTFSNTFTLERKFTGNYYEYVPKSVTASSVSVVGAPAFVPIPSPVIAQPNAKPTVIHSSVYENRIKLYLLNCKFRNFSPTLKQVQSAIKRDSTTGLTQDQLREIIGKGLGYRFSNGNYSGAVERVCV